MHLIYSFKSILFTDLAQHGACTNLADIGDDQCVGFGMGEAKPEPARTNKKAKMQN